MPNTSYKYYRAFGWLVVEVMQPDGHMFRATVPESKLRQESDSITLYTKGVLTNRCLTDDLPVVGREPGVFSGHLFNPRAGTYEFTAHGDVHWFCIDRKNNKGLLPNVEPVVMQPGDVRQFAAGAKVMLCEGTATLGGAEMQGPRNIKDIFETFELTAVGNVYGLLFLD